MQRCERTLQILIALMAVLGTCLMSLDGQTPMMTPLMLAAAVCGVVFTDILGWFRLHRYLINIVAVVAMVVTIGDFMKHDSTGQLLSIAYLLVSWEAVMLFQAKSPRVYWCIAVLSLLQVVVASVLNVGMTFGLLLLLYVTVAFFALIAFFIYRELLQQAQGQLAPAQGRWRSAAARSPTMAARGESSADDLRRQLPLGKLLRELSLLGGLSLVFATTFFYGAPRLTGASWRATGGARAKTGFTKQISLRAMGEILQSNQRVLRMVFLDQDGQRYRVFGDPYLHGGVLTQYDRGQWRGPSEAYTALPLQPAPIRRDMPLVRQVVTMQPASDGSLFAALPALRDREMSQHEILFNDSQQSLQRSAEMPDYRHPYRYSVLTPVFVNGVQSAVRPFIYRLQPTFTGRSEFLPELAGSMADGLLAIDREAFPELIRAAQEIVDKAGAKAGRIQIARLLESYFKNTQVFKYSLSFQDVARQRNSKLDPIEDFVANHHTGHCEYFASALVMMLRSQGIPARIVVGYHGGEYNALGDYFQVRQRDAHAWVEAYLRPEDVPNSALGMKIAGDLGGWLRLDPTPAGEERQLMRDGLDQMLDFAQLLWNDYVLELNPETQQKTLDRLAGQESGAVLLKLRGTAERLRAGVRRMLSGLKVWLGGRWFSWQAGVAASCLCLLLWGLARLAAPLAGLIRRWRWRRASAPRAAAPRIEFYVRLERLLHSLQLRREPQATQREFALRAADCLRSTPGLEPLADVPAQVAAAYYRVRFGQRALDKVEADAIEQALRRLEQALHHRPHPAGG